MKKKKSTKKNQKKLISIINNQIKNGSYSLKILNRVRSKEEIYKKIKNLLIKIEKAQNVLIYLKIKWKHYQLKKGNYIQIVNRKAVREKKKLPMLKLN